MRTKSTPTKFAGNSILSIRDINPFLQEVDDNYNKVSEDLQEQEHHHTRVGQQEEEDDFSEQKYDENNLQEHTDEYELEEDEILEDQGQEVYVRSPVSIMYVDMEVEQND